MEQAELFPSLFSPEPVSHAGGKIRIKVDPAIESTTQFYRERGHRTKLSRVWDRTNPRRALIVMMNPSIADTKIDDPTVSKVTFMAKTFWKTEDGQAFGGLHVGNSQSLCATYPAELNYCPNTFRETPVRSVIVYWRMAMTCMPWAFVKTERPFIHSPEARHLSQSIRFLCSGSRPWQLEKHDHTKDTGSTMPEDEPPGLRVSASGSRIIRQTYGRFQNEPLPSLPGVARTSKEHSLSSFYS